MTTATLQDQSTQTDRPELSKLPETRGPLCDLEPPIVDAGILASVPEATRTLTLGTEEFEDTLHECFNRAALGNAALLPELLRETRANGISDEDPRRHIEDTQVTLATEKSTRTGIVKRGISCQTARPHRKPAMTMPRTQLVDSSVTSYYHCISRCVRRAFLCGEGCEHRKQWIEDRLQELASIFAIEVCAYAVLDNHMHVVLRLNDDAAKQWSDEDVVRRWGKLFPPRGKDRKPLEVSDAWVEAHLKDAKWVAETRKRLNELGWFMKCLKEPLARMANKEDKCRGTFWEARFKSIAILDEEALLSTLAYVDLNPLAAGVAKTLKSSPHTSVKSRIKHARETGTLQDTVKQPADRTRRGTVPEDESFWLVPIQELRESGGARAGMTTGMNLAGYLRLLDWTARLSRPGKTRLPRDVADILTQLGSSPDVWQHRQKSLQKTSRIFGVAFATKAASLNKMAEARGVTKLANVSGGCG